MGKILDRLEFEISARVILVRATDMVGQEVHPTRFEHAHDHRCPGTGQAGNDSNERFDNETPFSFSALTEMNIMYLHHV